MSFHIRQADNRDVEGVVNVIHAVFDEYSFTWEEDGYHADLYDIETHYTGCGDTFFVAEKDGVVIGTIALERFDLIPGAPGDLKVIEGYSRVQGCDCSLERMYVHPDSRRFGAGSGLINHVIAVAKGENRSAMEIWSDKRFGDAHRLYGRFGAKVVGDRILDDPDQSPEWGLMIDLRQP